MIYLTKEMLQQIEDKIEALHKKFREKFNTTETTLRNLQVGDYFGNQKLYFDFDNFIYFENEEENTNIIETDDKYKMYYYSKTLSKPTRYYIYLEDGDNRISVLGVISDVIINRNGFNTNGNSKVTSIKSDEDAFKSIKIKDDRYKLLAYTKKNWVDNEFPYMQYIDNIEEGINDVAETFYAPTGFDYKPWILKGNISNYNSAETNGLSQKTISEDDFVRWNKNIDLLEKAFDDIINIWNLISYINWNEESQFEWEDR